MLRTQAKKVEYTQKQTGNINKEIENLSKNSEGSEKNVFLNGNENAFDVACQRKESMRLKVSQ